MPWHKKRVFIDREAERRRRLVYRFDISILVASALLVLTVVAALLPLAQFWFNSSLHGGGVSDWPTTTQKLCGIVALLCLGYISLALNIRAKR